MSNNIHVYIFTHHKSHYFQTSLGFQAFLCVGVDSLREDTSINFDLSSSGVVLSEYTDLFSSKRIGKLGGSYVEGGKSNLTKISRNKSASTRRKTEQQELYQNVMYI